MGLPELAHEIRLAFELAEVGVQIEHLGLGVGGSSRRLLIPVAELGHLAADDLEVRPRGVQLASEVFVGAPELVALGGDRVPFRGEDLALGGRGFELGIGCPPRLELPLRLLVLLLDDRQFRPRGLELVLDQPGDLLADGHAGPELGLGAPRLFLGGPDPRVELTDRGLLGGERFLGPGEVARHALELAPQVRLLRPRRLERLLRLQQVLAFPAQVVDAAEPAGSIARTAGGADGGHQCEEGEDASGDRRVDPGTTGGRGLVRTDDLGHDRRPLVFARRDGDERVHGSAGGLGLGPVRQDTRDLVPESSILDADQVRVRREHDDRVGAPDRDRFARVEQPAFDERGDGVRSGRIHRPLDVLARQPRRDRLGGIFGRPTRFERQPVVHLARLQVRERGRTCQGKCEHRECHSPRPNGNAHAQILPSVRRSPGSLPVSAGRGVDVSPSPHEFRGGPSAGGRATGR